MDILKINDTKDFSKVKDLINYYDLDDFLILCYIKKCSNLINYINENYKVNENYEINEKNKNNSFYKIIKKYLDEKKEYNYTVICDILSSGNFGLIKLLFTKKIIETPLFYYNNNRIIDDYGLCYHIGKSGYHIIKYLNNKYNIVRGLICKYCLLYGACSSGSIKTVKYIVNKIFINNELNYNYENGYIYICACKSNNVKLIKFLFNKYYSEELIYFCLTYSSSYGSMDILKYLLNNYEIDLRYGNDEMLKSACIKNNEEIMRYLIYEKKIYNKELIEKYCKDVMIKEQDYRRKKVFLIGKIFGCKSFNDLFVKPSINNLILTEMFL